MTGRFLTTLLVVLAIGAVFYFVFNRNPASAPSTQENTSFDNNAQMLDQAGDYEISSTDVNYYGEVFGYYAAPDQDGDYPGVIMIHEWWGLNDHIKDMAEELASNGYRVLAVDLFNGSVAETPDEARAQTSSLNQEEALANMRAAQEFLQGMGATRIASLGWCFGGGQSMQFTLNSDLDATVIYYGNLVTDQNQLTNIDHPVLGVFGDQDQSIPVQTVREFETALNNIGVENEIYIYEEVGHAFANPSGANYAPTETMDAWQKTLDFLNRNLK